MGPNKIALKTFKNSQGTFELMKPLYFSVCDGDTRLVVDT